MFESHEIDVEVKEAANRFTERRQEAGDQTGMLLSHICAYTIETNIRIQKLTETVADLTGAIERINGEWFLRWANK